LQDRFGSDLAATQPVLGVSTSSSPLPSLFQEMDTMNREMSRKNGDGGDKLRPGEKIALRLKENGVPIQSMQAGIDDVARGKIKKLTKYYTSLSVLYQQSITELKGHSENRPETSSDTGHRRRSPPENGGTSHLFSPL